MRADARGRRAGDSHAGENDYGEMAERAADFPQPSHGACEGGRVGFEEATGDLACVREAARGCDPVPTRHIAGRAHADRQAREAPVPAPPGPAAPRRPGRCRVAGDCLAALLAAESAEVAYDGPGARAEGIARVSDLGPVIDALMCVKGVGFSSALAFAAEVGDFSRFASGRKVTSYFGLAPSESSSAESRRLGRISRNGRALVRKPLIEGAWVLARGNPACRKRGGTSVPLAIREHARACSGRLLERRRGLVSRGPAPREANTATAAEMARMPPHVGRDAQEAAALAAEVALVA